MNGRGANKNSQQYTDALSDIMSQGLGSKNKGIGGTSSQKCLGSLQQTPQKIRQMAQNRNLDEIRESVGKVLINPSKDVRQSNKSTLQPTRTGQVSPKLPRVKGQVRGSSMQALIQQEVQQQRYASGTSDKPLHNKRHSVGMPGQMGQASSVLPHLAGGLSPYRNQFAHQVNEAAATIDYNSKKQDYSSRLPKNPSDIKLGAVGGFSVHKNPFNLKNSNSELHNMLKEVVPTSQPLKRTVDPTIVGSTFNNSVEAKTKIGHKRQPLGDWDVVAIEDARRFQIEQTDARIRKKRAQKDLAEYYDKQKDEKYMSTKNEADYYHTRAIPSIKKGPTVKVQEPGKEASLEFQGNAAQLKAQAIEKMRTKNFTLAQMEENKQYQRNQRAANSSIEQQVLQLDQKLYQQELEKKRRRREETEGIQGFNKQIGQVYDSAAGYTGYAAAANNISRTQVGRQSTIHGIEKVGSATFLPENQRRPDHDENYQNYFDKNQKQFRDRLVNSDNRQKVIFTQQVNSDLKNQALASVARDKSLSCLVEKAGTDGAKFHVNDVKLQQEGNSRKVVNKDANLQIALSIQQQKQMQVKSDIMNEKEQMKEHMRNVQKAETMARDEKTDNAQHMRMYYNMQHMTKERTNNVNEKQMRKEDLLYNKPRIDHLL